MSLSVFTPPPFLSLIVVHSFTPALCPYFQDIWQAFSFLGMPPVRIRANEYATSPMLTRMHGFLELWDGCHCDVFARTTKKRRTKSWHKVPAPSLSQSEAGWQEVLINTLTSVLLLSPLLFSAFNHSFSAHIVSCPYPCCWIACFKPKHFQKKNIYYMHGHHVLK